MAFTVTYNSNGSTGGTVPVDGTSYASGAKVTVLGNTGNLTEAGGTFAYWNTAADGSGTVYGGGASFNITANVTLYAQWFITTGLTNGGVTAHYAFSYDSALQKTAANPSGPEPARTNALIAVCESDYNLMAAWFGGISLTLTVPLVTHVTNQGGGAGWGPPLTLKPGNGDATLCRYLVVSEVVEMFEYAQNQGWFAPDGSNEQSCGEALSRFCGQQFLVLTGIGVIEPGYAISPSWLNSSLPSGTAGSSQLGSQLTTLPGAIDSSVASFSVAKATTIPFASTYLIQIDSEQMLVTAVDTTTNTLTVTRAVNGTAAANHAANAAVFHNYGARADYINLTLEYDHGIDAATGCGMLFLYYLHIQLGFSIDAIIAAAPGASKAASCLRGVYQNLTGDTGDPFPFFQQLLNNAFPPTQVASIPGPNPDNPWPLGSLSFYGVKNTWGKDEVNDIIAKGGSYPDAFYLMLDGFNRQVAGSATPSDPTIAFGGTSSSLDVSGTGILYETSNPYVPQRILYPYDVSFTSSGLGPFPASGETVAAVTTSMSILGLPLQATTEFFFLAGADPYFTNVLVDPSNPTNVNVPWLSEDLRVFTATPGAPPSSGNQYPVPGGPQFVEHSVGGNYDVQGAYAYLQALLLDLNQNYGDPESTDPFDPSQNVIPGQAGAYTGDSSVTPSTKVGGQNYNNYSFAIARVRLRGTAGPLGAAIGVRVFFRLWQTQTADTDWQPTYTYLSHNDSSGNPLWPLAPSDDHTIPFFATSNTPNFTDPGDPEFGATGYTNTGVNNQTITIQQGDGQWAYFGCFLNVNDPTFVVNGEVVPQSLPGTHHCLVAQIAYAGAPIQNVGTVIESPETGDQLAQRNLQVTTSDNPGPPSTHRVPQTFDARPSAVAYDGSAATYPDELMIDWGNTPVGAVASIYWPQVDSGDLVALASRLYGTHPLTAADGHTVQCRTTNGVTYIPIPYATVDSFAGLFTLDLPQTVVTGQEFDIVVRRIGNRKLKAAPPPPPPPPQIQAVTTQAHQTQPAPSPAAATFSETRTERYIVGSFQVKVPVTTGELMLPAEETTLAIFKARLAAMSPTNRWYPVLVRYIGLVSGRINGLGGNANSIPPSLEGYPTEVTPCQERGLELTGKVGEVIFDCFGDLVGFVLCTCCKDHRFHARESAIRDLVLRACKERLLLSVFVEPGNEQKIKELVVRC
jgi:hypothetical protein